MTNVPEKIRQIIQELANGVALKEACQKVNWEYQTARNAIQVFRREIGCTSIVHLIAAAIGCGWIKPPAKIIKSNYIEVDTKFSHEEYGVRSTAEGLKNLPGGGPLPKTPKPEHTHVPFEDL